MVRTFFGASRGAHLVFTSYWARIPDIMLLLVASPLQRNKPVTFPA